MTPEEEIQRAGRAREVLENEMFKEAVADIEQALLMGIRQSAFKDPELREKLCHRYALLHDLIQQLQSRMETGEMAKTMLERARETLGF